MKKYLLLPLLLLIACQQQIADVPPTINAPTSTSQPTQAVPTETVEAVLPTVEIPTATPVTFPAPAALPAGPISLIAIGDSLTQGDGDDSGRGYPGRLLEIITPNRPGSTLSNFGKSGWSSDALINGDQGLPGQLGLAVGEVQAAAEQGRGAVVLVWIGSNDLWYLYEYGGDVTDAQEQEDLQRYSANMDAILTQLRGAGAQVIVALLDDQSKRPVALKGEAFTAITQDELARMSVQAQRYNEVIVQKAAQYGALTVDFYNTTIFINSATLYDDGNHPNQAGYDLIAQKWYEMLAQLLSS
ncbi:MAG TPA: SGNH/GDSL hydrolase family protein [Anaerolineales bacterium]|nr:SGNH/GDSL hydrolase family protein [Anaerolineales bacterium]HNN13943.1 SGNH/GDSL hydrolase family protein [Anaerolineales bacterium]HNO31439.1 SGNH/GDSL hydrolase family protein [Anaerolineales bacterium]